MKSQHSEVFYYAIAVYAVAALAIITTPAPAERQGRTATASHQGVPPTELLNAMPITAVPLHAPQPTFATPALAAIPAKL